MKTFEICFEDLTPKAQQEYMSFVGDEVNEFIPIAVIEIEDEDDNAEEEEEETAMENQKKEAPKKINVEVNGKKVNNWKDGLKRFGIAAVKALAAMGDAVEEDPAKELNLQTEVTLKAEDLKQLCGMSSWQLERIFKGKKVKLADDPAVYRELKNFSSWQLEKIFGEED
jgi:hypothetical protein